MKFINLDPIGYQEQIEILQDGHSWDLHNAADFTGYDLNEELSILALRWDYGCDCEGIIEGEIRLKFKNVSRIEISEKDLQVPRSEDACLEYFKRLNENTLKIEFRGGQVFKFCCDAIEFISGETTGHKL